MHATETGLSGPLLIESAVYRDERGFFQEIYRRSALADMGIADDFVQHNHSRSRGGIVRGMHFQPGMAKLIHCVRGSILDVLVDIRAGSETFGRWEAFELSDENHRRLYCPDGFAHGFCVLNDVADVIYGCSDYYDPERERGFAYNDTEIDIGWPPGMTLVASSRDAAAPSLRDLNLRG